MSRHNEARISSLTHRSPDIDRTASQLRHQHGLPEPTHRSVTVRLSDRAYEYLCESFPNEEPGDVLRQIAEDMANQP
jgi:hypothetical protein